MNRHKVKFLLLIVGLITVISGLKLVLKEQDLKDINITGFPSASTPRLPIDIDGNSEMDSFLDKTGLGTAISPYIIQGYEIDAGGLTNPITIQNVNKYVVIQNCELFNSIGGSSSAGILLNSCGNITVQFNTIRDNLGKGVFINDSFGLEIRNNTIYNNGREGIYTYWASDNVIISGNELTDNGADLFDGIYASWGDYVQITYNTITGNKHTGGITCNVDHAVILGNDIDDISGFGIYLYGTNCSIMSNTVNNTEITSIMIGQDYNNITLNTIDNFGNYGEGIAISYGDYNLINNNTILYSEYSASGISIDENSFQNTVEYNYIEYGRGGKCIIDEGIDSNIRENTCVLNVPGGVKSFWEYLMYFVPQTPGMDIIGWITFVASIIAIITALIKVKKSLKKENKDTSKAEAFQSLLLAFLVIALAKIEMNEEFVAARGEYTVTLIFSLSILFLYLFVLLNKMNVNVDRNESHRNYRRMLFLFFLFSTFVVVLISYSLKAFMIGGIADFLINYYPFIIGVLIIALIIQGVAVSIKKKENIKKGEYPLKSGVVFSYTLISLSASEILLAPLTAIFFISDFVRKIKEDKEEKEKKEKEKDAVPSQKEEEPLEEEEAEDRFIDYASNRKQYPWTHLLFQTGMLIFFISSVFPWIVGLNVQESIPLWLLIYGYLCWIFVFFKLNKSTIAKLLVIGYVLISGYLIIDFQSNPAYISLIQFGDTAGGLPGFWNIFVYIDVVILMVVYIIIIIKALKSAGEVVHEKKG